MASSQLYPGELIIDDDFPDDHAALDGPRGLTLNLRRTGYGAMYGAPAFPSELLIPRSEWQARIEEMEQRKSRLSDVIVQAKLPCKDQGQTNLCWANAPTHCIEILRVAQNQPMVILSPASVAGPINNFQNQGGWGEQALQQIVDHGACPVDMWPANAIDRRLYTQVNRDAAMLYRAREWWECVPRNLDQLVSCLLRRIPAACGYNWMGHEMTAVDAVWLDGEVAIRDRNSWGDRPDWPNGFGVLRGSRMYPDDCVAPRTVVAS